MSTLTATIQADTSGFNSAVERANRELKQFDRSNKSLADTMRKTNNVSDIQVQAFNKSVTALSKIKNGYTTNKQSAKILKDEIEKLTRQYKGLSDEAKKGEFGRSMSNVINRAKIELKGLDIELGKSTDKTKIFYEGLSSKNFLNAFNLANITTAVTNLGKIFSKLGDVVVSLSDNLKTNENVLDSWGRAAEGAHSVADSFFRTLAGNAHMSNMFYAYSLGKAKYDADDALGSFYANNAEWYAKILQRTQELKTRKKDGSGATQEEIDSLKEEVNNYYTQAANYVKNRQKAYIKEVEGDFQDPNYNVYVPIELNRYVKADDANKIVEEWQTKLKEKEEELRKEETEKRWMTNIFSDEYEKQAEKVEKLRTEFHSATSEYGALKKLTSMETSHLQKIKEINVQLAQAKQEKERLTGEILEAKETPKKEKTGKEKSEKIRKKISDLHKEDSEIKQQIKELDDNYDKEIQTTKEILAITNDSEMEEHVNASFYKKRTEFLDQRAFLVEQVKKNREELLRLYSGVESDLTSEFWEIHTNILNAKLLEPLDDEYYKTVVDESVEALSRYILSKNLDVKKYMEIVAKETSPSYTDYLGSPEIQDYVSKVETATFLKRANAHTGAWKNGKKGIGMYNFSEYKDSLDVLKEHNELASVASDSVKEIANAWSNVWNVIETGNETLKETMSALGGTVSDFANMFVELSKIQFQAAQASALAKGNESASGLPFPYNLAAMATVTSFLMSSFARFKSIGRFAEGGIVGGSSTIGDYNIARVNSGEMILNGSQQRNLFNLLNNGNSNSTKISGGDIRFRIEGKDIVGAVKNYSNRLNRVR